MRDESNSKKEHKGHVGVDITRSRESGGAFMIFR
jgi:hypothetical protein